jgi:hypothetical protein
MSLGGYRGWAQLLPSRESGLGRVLIVSGLATAAAVAIRWPLSELLAGLPFVTFFPAVAAAAVLGGTAAGLITILAGSLVAAWLPGSEGLGFWANRTVATIAFVVVSVVTVALIHFLHVLHEEVRGREEQLRVIVSEMQHRIGNAFSMIQVLVRLSESRAIDVPTFSRTVQERIGAFQRAQRLIQLDNKQDVELRTLCREVLTPVRSAARNNAGDLGPRLIGRCHHAGTGPARTGNQRSQVWGVDERLRQCCDRLEHETARAPHHLARERRPAGERARQSGRRLAPARCLSGRRACGRNEISSGRSRLRACPAPPPMSWIAAAGMQGRVRDEHHRQDRRWSRGGRTADVRAC